MGPLINSKRNPEQLTFVGPMCPLKLRLGAFSGPGRPLTHPRRRSAGYRSPFLPGRGRPGRGRLLGSYSFSFRRALNAVPTVDLPQPVPFLQRPRGAQDVACSTIMIIIRFLFSFWISCALLRFAQLWYFMFWGACFSMLYLPCHSCAVVVGASARRFLGSWSGSSQNVNCAWRRMTPLHSTCDSQQNQEALP